VAVILFRMAQEALANVRKHAKASRVDVVLGEQDGGYLVRIADDGVGFSTTKAGESVRGHLGLSSMRERAGMAGGWCRLHSLPGQGTTVELWVPRPAVADPESGPGRVVEVPRRAAVGDDAETEAAVLPAVPA
jgi:signal transduction histidine kinase